MKNLILKSLLIVPVVLSGQPRALAHHSFAAVFDGSQTTSVEGVVTEFLFVNPHATMGLEVTDADGTRHTRIVEFDGELNLINGGWNGDTIRVGERVTVHGNPERSGGDRIWFLSLTREDGSELVRPMTERLNSIEEARRRRAEQRRQQE